MLINDLFAYADEDYKKFNERLVKTNYEIIGIRMPIQRKLAKQITTIDLERDYKYFEEINMLGFAIGSLTDEKKFYQYFYPYLTKIDNWATCDSFCASLKIVPTIEVIQKLLKSKHEYTVRVGLVILLNYYVKEEYLKIIFSLVDNLNRNEYYINMAIAWVISICYIKYPEETISYLKNNNLSKFTFNKTISKIRDSYQVSSEAKEYLKTIKKM